MVARRAQANSSAAVPRKSLGGVEPYIDALVLPSGEALLFFGHLVDVPQLRSPLGCRCRLTIANHESIIFVC